MCTPQVVRRSRTFSSMLPSVVLCAVFISVLALQSSESACGQDLVLQWAFDEESGDALDTGAAPAADGTLGTAAVRSSDTPGGGPGFAIDLSAPGADSIVDGGFPDKVDSLAQVTMTTWLKMTGDNAVDQGGSNNLRLISKQSGNATFDTFTWNANCAKRRPDT